MSREQQITSTKRGELFGFLEKRPVINLIMLIGKQFLASQKYKQGLVTYDAFYQNLFKMFSIEKEIARKKWRDR